MFCLHGVRGQALLLPNCHWLCAMQIKQIRVWVGMLWGWFGLPQLLCCAIAGKKKWTNPSLQQTKQRAKCSCDHTTTLHKDDSIISCGNSEKLKRKSNSTHKVPFHHGEVSSGNFWKINTPLPPSCSNYWLPHNNRKYFISQKLTLACSSSAAYVLYFSKG